MFTCRCDEKTVICPLDVHVLPGLTAQLHLSGQKMTNKINVV